LIKIWNLNVDMDKLVKFWEKFLIIDKIFAKYSWGIFFLTRPVVIWMLPKLL